MADIARLARVSKPTVSRALADSPLVNPETKAHILRVAQEHGYAVNRNAQNLRQKRTNTIAVSLDYQSHRKNHISDPFIYELLGGVSEALGERNQVQLLCAPKQNKLEDFLNILSSRMADGFIFLGQGHREDLLRDLAQAGAPLVVWGAASPDTPYCVVGSDNFRGGYLAGQHFAQSQRRHILFVGDTSFREIALRMQGLKAAIQESTSEGTIEALQLSHFSYDSAFNAAKEFLSATPNIPDAIFAFSDTAAMAFINACQRQGLSVPEDVSVIGYNDIPVAAYFSPPLTTIRQDVHAAGHLLVSNLIKIIHQKMPRGTTLKTQLIVRDT
ncbi:MAG: LacI family DNA-binding transcriptional regulator [Acidobacteria bacterium]|nr:LacI family DNA-binding transcriptional regulator [Acidobacteriota bacterium]